MAAMERIVIASAPFQTAYMRFRHIYRWEDTNDTLFALAGFLFLWLFNLLSLAAVSQHPFPTLVLVTLLMAGYIRSAI